MSRGTKVCRSIESSIGTRCATSLGRGIRRGDDGLDPAANAEVTDDGHPAGRAGGDEIVEDLVGDRLVEDPAVAELDEVVLQYLQLDTAIARNVGDADLAEVGQPGFRTHGGELGTGNCDLVVAPRARIGKCLDRRRA